MLFASGGHSGQVIVIGLPSMRILKYIAVFTPEPWQGYGYGDQTDEVLAAGQPRRPASSPGPTPTTRRSARPTASTTGQYLFINDKANARVAVIDLKDFVTKQIVNSHG